MFGELVGLCLAQAWIEQGRPARATLAEGGPGRGTLMADLMRATARVEGFHAAVDLVLVEPSPALRAVQAETLRNHAPRWIDGFDDLPEAPLYFVANEMFDALPIRQFQRAGDGWRERQVGVQDNALTFGLGPMQPQPALADRLEDTREGDVVEYCGALP